MNKKITRGRLSLLLALGWFILLLAFYIPHYVIEQSADWWEYTRHFLGEIFSFIFPVICGATIYADCSGVISKRTFATALILSASYAANTLPYYYLMALGYSFDSLEAVVISLIVTVGFILLAALQSLVFAFIIGFLVRRAAKAEIVATLPPLRRNDTPDQAMNAEISAKARDMTVGASPYDFSVPMNFAIFVTVMAELVLKTVLELWDTVGYLIEYAGSYRISEIIFITASYVVILLTMLLTQFITVKLFPHFGRCENNE